MTVGFDDVFSATDYMLATIVTTMVVSSVSLTMIGTTMTFSKSIINNGVCSIHGIVIFGISDNNGGGLEEEGNKRGGK